MNTNLLASVPYENILNSKSMENRSSGNTMLLQAGKELERKISSYESSSFISRNDKVSKDFVCTESLRLTINALNPIIPIRRISSVPDRIENKDYVSSVGLTSIAAILLPEDLRDMRDAGKQLFSIILPKKLKAMIANRNRKFYKRYIRYKPKFSCKDYQTPFSFIRGSFLEKPINKLGKVGYYLHKWDKTIFDTKLGNKVADLLGVSVADQIKSGRKVERVIFSNNIYEVKSIDVMSLKLSGSSFSKLICRSMQRVSVYGLLTFAALSLPEIVRAFKKPEDNSNKLKNGSEQVFKSAIKVLTTMSGIGIVGTLLAPFGPMASIAGMGIGSVLASTLNSKMNVKIKTSY